MQKVAPQWKWTLKPLVKLNIASSVTFMGFYFALKYIEPAIVSSLEMGIGPIFILILLFMQRKPMLIGQWAIAFGTFLSCGVLICAVLAGQSGVGMQLSSEMVLGVIASILCGAGAVMCTVYSQLSEIGWTSSMILAKRFIGVVVVSFILTFDLIIPYFKDNIVWILLVTVVGVMLPMYLLQKGIQYTNTFLVMMSLSFVPVFTFAIQLLDARIQFSALTFIGVVLLFIYRVSSIFIENRKNQPY